jgi:hypothetical protein
MAKIVAITIARVAFAISFKVSASFSQDHSAIFLVSLAAGLLSARARVLPYACPGVNNHS